MPLNTLLTIVTFVAIVAFVLVVYLKTKKERSDRAGAGKLTFDSLLDVVKSKLADLIKDENFSGLADEEFESMFKRKARIQDAMRNCVYGIDSAKLIVQDLIRSTIAEVLPDEETLSEVFDFNAPYLEPRVKFEILMYFYKKKHGKDALAVLIKEYNLADVRYEIENKTKASYMITNQDIDRIYAEKLSNEIPEEDDPSKVEYIRITYPAMLDLLSVLIYQKYKGFGVIDTLREMNINGFNCGTSGSILSSIMNKERKVMEAPRSVWLYHEGKYIHLRFLSFHSEEELRRVVQLLCRYNNPGPLTEKRGYLVNTMYDKSRVLALRPPAAEYWAVFVRKFTLNDASLRSLIVKDEVNNAEVAMELIRYLMMGEITTGFTGRQGSGKTTMMAAAIEPIDPRFTMRILEMAPELYARELYPERNILSVQETEFVSAQALQDALKKSDAAVSIVGEVATDPIAARMIQMGRVASIFTIFSHHANTTEDLIYAIRDSLVNAAGGAGDLKVAERNAIDVIRMDVHLDYTTDGLRYIDRISEIIKLEEGVPYPEYDQKNPIHSMNKITAEYYKRTTDRQTFTTRDILRFNKETLTYETEEWMTVETTKRILKALPHLEVPKFKEFVSRNWKIS